MAETNVPVTIYLLVLFVIVMVLILIRRGQRKRFFVSLGHTGFAHHDFVKRLKGFGHSEAFSHQECDYVVAFCPVASRVGTDVAEALNRVPGDKPTILVVMHHSFNENHVVADSSRLVTNPNVLTVDCLFYEGHFLQCRRNDAAWEKVSKYLSQKPFSESALGLVFWFSLMLLALGMYVTAKILIHLSVGSD